MSSEPVSDTEDAKKLRRGARGITDKRTVLIATCHWRHTLARKFSTAFWQRPVEDAGEIIRDLIRHPYLRLEFRGRGVVLLGVHFARLAKPFSNPASRLS